MITEFKMPKMGESISEATIISWLKNVGDFVEAEETILEVATDKVDSDVPAPVSGVITEIRFQKDDVVFPLCHRGAVGGRRFSRVCPGSYNLVDIKNGIAIAPTFWHKHHSWSRAESFQTASVECGEGEAKTGAQA